MFRQFIFLLAAMSLLALAACQSGNSATLESARGTMVAVPSAPTTPAADYRIGKGDQLDINVFQVEELKAEKIRVDAAGQIQMPLIGSVRAQGRTTTELAADIAGKLGERYLQAPQVSVVVVQAASQKVTVDGAVVEAGVYEISGRTSLMQAVAMAKGPSQAARLDRVAVFRDVNGQRMAAVFDLRAIRQGNAPDPEILGDDIIVVDSSAIRGAWSDIIRTLPALNVFRPF